MGKRFTNWRKWTPLLQVPGYAPDICWTIFEWLYFVLFITTPSMYSKTPCACTPPSIIYVLPFFKSGRLCHDHLQCPPMVELVICGQCNVLDWPCGGPQYCMSTTCCYKPLHILRWCVLYQTRDMVDISNNNAMYSARDSPVNYTRTCNMYCFWTCEKHIPFVKQLPIFCTCFL